jgi:polyhydroxybutyrate depolymerase
VKRPGGSSEDAIPIGRRVLLVAAAVAALAGSPPPPAAAASAESTIIVGGRARSFLLEWPALQEPRPAIIILHGAGGGIRPFADLPQRALDAGAVILVPRGIGGRWNFFPPGRESEKERQFFQQYGGIPDDVGFLKELVADVVARGMADPRRIYVAGLSLGGVMALRMACTEAGLFAATAVLIAGMDETGGAECRPAKPLPLLVVNGTADQLVPYGGGQTSRGDSVWPTERLAGFFRRLNGCPAGPIRSIAVQDPQRIEVESSTGCPGGAVVLYRVVGGGHEVPAALNVDRRILDFFGAQTNVRSAIPRR